MPDIPVSSDLPPPLVDYVPPLQWYTLQAGTGNMLKKIVNITAAGHTILNGSPATYNEVYVNAPAPGVSISMPLEAQLIAGQEWAIKDEAGTALANNITVQPYTTGVLIDGRPTFVLDGNYASLTMTWNGVGFSVKT
jgi:hypothetical protein